jgi:3-isopropylmalate/(R)-2-methylmalate dehydratase small subunit
MALVEADPTAEVTVDLDRREVRAGAITAAFELDDFTRWRLMEGLDDIGLTLRHGESITSYEESRPSWKPSATAR